MTDEEIVALRNDLYKMTEVALESYFRENKYGKF